MSDTGSVLVQDTHRPMNMNYKSEDVYILYLHILYHVLLNKFCIYICVCVRVKIKRYIQGLHLTGQLVGFRPFLSTWENILRLHTLKADFVASFSVPSSPGRGAADFQ